MSTTTRVPHSPPGTRVVMVTVETAPMEAKASPLNPRVPMADRSSWVLILLVAWRIKARAIWSLSIPHPLSVTRIMLIPPSRISMVMAVEPASMEFSTSSLTTLRGLSMTSPAEIRLMVSSVRSLISIISSFFFFPSFAAEMFSFLGN